MPFLFMFLVGLLLKISDDFEYFSFAFQSDFGYFIVCQFKFEEIWGIERSGFFNDRGKWVKSFENQRV